MVACSCIGSVLKWQQQLTGHVVLPISRLDSPMSGTTKANLPYLAKIKDCSTATPCLSFPLLSFLCLLALQAVFFPCCTSALLVYLHGQLCLGSTETGGTNEEAVSIRRHRTKHFALLLPAISVFLSWDAPVLLIFRDVPPSFPIGCAITSPVTHAPGTPLYLCYMAISKAFQRPLNQLPIKCSIVNT